MTTKLRVSGYKKRSDIKEVDITKFKVYINQVVSRGTRGGSPLFLPIRGSQNLGFTYYMYK